MAEQLAILNANPRRMPGPRLLHDLVSRCQPQALAIHFSPTDGDDVRITYADLHAQSDALAARLVRLNAKLEGQTGHERFLVPLFMPQSPAAYIAQIAVLKAGGAFCPLALDAPPDRLRFIVKDDLEARFVLSTEEAKARFPYLPGVAVMTIDEVLHEQDNIRLLPVPTPDTAAYVLYTSGSTGLPKGVILSHDAVTQALLAHDRHIPTFSRFLQFANLTFDVSVFESFFPFFRGATVVCTPRAELLNDLPLTINRLNVDAAELTPSVASSLLNGRDSVPKLKVLLTIGEMLKRSVVEQFGGDDTEPSILSGMYGPTEAAIHCTLQSNFSRNMPVGNIGRPLDTVSAFVVKPASESSEHQQIEILNVGQEGELAVGGFQLADGYLKREGQTKAAFVHHHQYGRIYRTGDRAVLHREGWLECLGRISSGQVKLRGQRVELGEVEYALTRNQACTSAAAAVIDGTLVAFCVSNDGAVTIKDIRQSCDEWLPKHMIPAEILFIGNLPYLPSGKMDKSALETMYRDRVVAHSSTESHPDPQSDTLVEIFSQTLGIEIRRSTDLASVGVDSLTAIRLASIVRRNGFGNIDANVVLKSQTIQDLSSRLNAYRRENAANGDASSQNDIMAFREAVLKVPALAGLQADIENIYQCTPMQEAMIMESLRRPSAYCNFVDIKIHKAPCIVSSAIKSLCKQHPLLRAGFVGVNEKSTPYALVVFRELAKEQTRNVFELGAPLRIKDDTDLLRPLRIEMLKTAKPEGTILRIHLHHALYDQWSMDILRLDLAALLEGKDLPTPSSFEAVSTYYARQATSSSTRSEKFWQQHLREAVLTNIPSLQPHVTPAKPSRSMYSVTLDVGSVKSSLVSSGIALPTVFQAAWTRLMAWYWGSTDLTYGVVFSGRHMPIEGLEHLFGPLLVTLPFRIDIASARTYLELIHEVQRINRTMQRHSATSIADIKRAAQFSADETLFDSLWVWQETSLVTRSSQPLVEEIDSVDQHGFNLVLELTPMPDHVQLRATYEEDLLPAEQVRMMLRQLDWLTHEILQNLHASPIDMALTMDSTLLAVSNRYPQSYANSDTVVTAFERCAKIMPTLPAVQFATRVQHDDIAIETLNYRDLNARANQLARHLRTLRVAPGDLVCICAEKSLELYVSILAVIKAGVGYIPLLPDTPTSRLAEILRNIKAQVCLCDNHMIPTIERISDLTPVSLRSPDIAAYDTENLGLATDLEATAYICFTSGSAGQPKGVQCTHRNLNSNLSALAELYKVRPGHRLLQSCSQAFDVSVFEIFFAFKTGMCLCAATRDVLFSDLEGNIRAFGVTHLSMTPTVAALVNPANVPSVKFLVTAGEAVTEAVRSAWAGRGLHQGYGPSETTNICSVLMDMTLNHAINNVGPPLANTSAFVISPDKPFSLLPGGSVGELAFGGEQVFRGYLNDEVLNSAKLLDHPEHGPLYRSGDLGRILHDGTILITGRIDDQIKVCPSLFAVRGNRVELGEVNAAIVRQPSVQDCTSTLISGPTQADDYLVTFIVPQWGPEISASTVRILQDSSVQIQPLFEALEEVLPSYMLPRFILPISTMPRTTQGKLDRRQLHALVTKLNETQIELFSRQTQSAEARDWLPLEREIAAVLSKTLHFPIDSISRNASFFGMGVDSLRAITFARALTQSLERPVGMNAIMGHPSVAQLAASLGRGYNKNLSRENSVTINVFSTGFVKKVKSQYEKKGFEVQAILPCTPLQEAILATSSAKGPQTYCNATSFTISGDLIRLLGSWQTLVERHQVLRSFFVLTESSEHPFAQVVVKNYAIPVHDFGHTLQKDAFAKARRELAPDSRPVLLGIRKTNEKIYLDVHMHHATYDGESFGILISEAEELYRGAILPPSPAFDPFLAEVIKQNKEASIRYWRELIRTYEPQPFPVFALDDLDTEMVVHSVTTIRAERLHSYAKRHAVTPLSILQAAFAAVLSLAQASRDICFGSVISGRATSVSGIARLAAPCFNTIPVRVQTAKRTNLELVQDLHTQNLAGLEHQLTGLRRIQAQSRKPHMPLFDAMLLLQPPRYKLDESIWILENEEGSMGSALVLELVPHGDYYNLHIHFLRSKVPSDLANRLLDAFNQMLETIICYTSGLVENNNANLRLSIDGELRTTQQDHNNDATTGLSGHNLADEWTPTERLIRRVFQQLSGVDEARISRRTSMYQIGLDSLNAAQIAARLRTLNYNIQASDVVECLTPTAIAAVALSRAKSLPAADVVDFTDFDRQYKPRAAGHLQLSDFVLEAVRPCTPVQCGMLAQSVESNGALYVNSVVYETPSDLSYQDICQAWTAVIRKHKALRTGFIHNDEPDHTFVAVIWKDIPQLPLQRNTLARNDEAKLHQISSEICQNLQLPPWRIFINPNDNVMTFIWHHTISDAEGIRYVLDDLYITLQGKSIGVEIGFDNLLLQALKASQPSTDSEAFWQETLRNMSVTRFPDLCPEVVKTARKTSHHRRSTLTAANLEQYCQSINATIQSLGQALWASLLSVYTGEANVCFGTILSHRSGSTHETTAFPSIMTLPVVSTGASSLTDLVHEMVTYNSKIHRHRGVSLAAMQRLAGHGSRSLFDTVFVYQKFSHNPNKLPWRVLCETSSVDYTASLELEISITGSVELHLTTDDAKVPYAQAEVILEQYDLLLQQLFGFEPPMDEQRLLSISPANIPFFPTDARLLHDLVAASVSTWPEKQALEFVDEMNESGINRKSWTYRELDERSNQVANALLKEGSRVGDIVAIRMNKCPEASFAFIGILKAGCAFLAIDPDLPQARQKFIFEDAKIKIVLIGPSDLLSKEDAALSGFSFLRLNEEALNLFSASVAPPPVSLTPESTCYCLYTSGTTGNPKGVEITHDNVVQAMLAFRHLFAGRWTPSSRWLQFASYWFDVQVLEQFWSWSVGITVVGAPRDIVLADIPAFIDRLRITHIDLTPSLALLVPSQAVPSLHGGVFITGGEALKQDIIDNWGPVYTVANGYGPTEATIGVTMNIPVGPNAKPTNIGKQFENVGAYVLEPDSDKPVLRGAVGELCVSGRLVGKGYLNRPDLTAKSFPYLKRYGERVYRTGDLVRLLADGSFSFIGRKDTSQAKLRGQRLELSEIDHAVRTSTNNIKETQSMVIIGAGSKQTLVTFIIVSVSRPSEDVRILATPEAKQFVSRALEACRRSLPGYMVPTHVLPISRLPLTVNNKVDLKRLEQFYKGLGQDTLQELSRDCEDSAPTTRDEQRIAQIASDFLKIPLDTVQKHSNVLSLGLSSVSAIALARILKRSGFANASVTAIMQNPTIASLAKDLANTSDATSQSYSLTKQAELHIAAFSQRYLCLAAKRLAIPTDQIETVTPCTPLQTGLLYDSLNHDDHPYFNEFHYRLDGVDVSTLQQSIELLAQDIEMLRTKYIQTTDSYAVVVTRTVEVSWHTENCKVSQHNRCIAEQRSQWLEANLTDVLQPLRFYLLIGDSQPMLVIFAHHASYDGISWELFLDAVASACNGDASAGYGPKFTDVLAYGPLRSQSQGKAFWQKRMSNFTHNSPRFNDVGDTASVEAHLWLRVGDAVDTLRRKLGVSHQTIMQACFEAALLVRFNNVRNYGHVVSGRNIDFEGADKVIGPLFNTLPARILLDSNDTWETYIKRCHESNVELLPYHHVPLRDIRKWCGISAEASLFNVIFVFQERQSESVAKKKGLWTEIEQPAKAYYPLAFEITLCRDKSLQVTAVAQRRLCNKDGLILLLQEFESALIGACKSSQKAIPEHMRLSDDAKGSAVKMDAVAPQYSEESSFIWTETAEILRNAIAQTASVDPGAVGATTSIYSLGLDSIDCVKLASLLRRSGLALPVSQILRLQTIKRIEDVVERITSPANGVLSHSRLDGLRRDLRKVIVIDDPEDAIEDVLPATPNQEALVADMIRSDFADYYNHDVLKLRPHIDTTRLKHALQEVVNRSRILRTAFFPVDAAELNSTFAQIVYGPSPMDVPESNINAPEDIDSVIKDITQDVRSSYHNRCPLRITLLYCAHDRYLVLSLAHAQYDGHSLALLHEDIQRAYHSSTKERPSDDTILEESLNVSSVAFRDYWAGVLSGGTRTPFPRSGFSEDSPATAYRANRISRLSSSQVRSFCQQNAVSLQCLAQSCWALLLAHYTRTLEVVFGVVLACRDTEEAEQIIFPAMNTVPIRATLHGTRAEMVKYMQSLVDEMRPYQRMPLREIKKLCVDDAKLEQGGLFDTIFIYQHRPQSAAGAQHEPLYDSVGGSSSVDYPVAVEMELVASAVHLRAACKASHLDEIGTTDLLHQLDEVLGALIEHPEDPTVDFGGDGVSICGMPMIELQTAPFAYRPGSSITADQQPGIQAPELTQAGIRIRRALAQVAKIQPDEILTSTTIESIGIDSISAIKVASLLRKSGVSLSVSQLVRARTLSNMVQMANNYKKSTTDRLGSVDNVIASALRGYDITAIIHRASIIPSDVETVIPATAGQLYMLCVWHRSSSHLFYPTFSYLLKTDADREQLQNTWDHLTARHSILRTVFCCTTGKAVPLMQLVLKSHRSEIAPDSDAKSWAYCTQPLVTLSVHREDRNWRLDLRIHHALYDAISLSLMMQDFVTLLRGTIPKTPSRRFPEYLALSSTPATEAARRQFWTQHLQRAMPRSLRQPPKTGQQRRVEIFKPAALACVSDYQRLARTESVTLQALVFAAYSKVYAEFTADQTKGEDVLLGIYLSNRAHLSDLDHLRAPTLNLVPLLVRSPDSKSILQIAKEIQANLSDIGTAENSAVSLAEIAEWTGLTVDTFINFLRAPEENGDETGGVVTDGRMIQELGMKRRGEYSRIVELTGEGEFQVPKGLEGLEKVASAYPFSVDLEVEVVDGALNMGLFCPEEMLGLGKGEEVIAQIKGSLGKITDQVGASTT